MSTVGVDLGIDDVRAARERIGDRARRTPLLPAGELSRRLGTRTLLKAENLQLTGSFKLRGAVNRLAQLSEAERAAGVVAASAGNHAQAVAFGARELGIQATAVMPAGAPLAKIAAVKQYGGKVVLNEGTYDDARHAADELSRSEGMTVIHAFDDPQVVAGQGTIGLEIVEDQPKVRLVVVPLGGGGLATGIAMTVKTLVPEARVVGVQAEACAPYIDSLAAHRPIGARSANTICDGIAVKQPGELTLPLVERWIDEVVTVSDDEVAQAMVLLLERSKLVVEGAG
ncbi:MAG TPA: threonine/serine dehydratase, partial [Thermoleophilaceae bacterium]